MPDQAQQPPQATPGPSLFDALVRKIKNPTLGEEDMKIQQEREGR